MKFVVTVCDIVSASVNNHFTLPLGFEYYFSLLCFAPMCLRMCGLSAAGFEAELKS